jgi:hypothetical protein
MEFDPGTSCLKRPQCFATRAFSIGLLPGALQRGSVRWSLLAAVLTSGKVAGERGEWGLCSSFVHLSFIFLSFTYLFLGCFLAFFSHLLWLAFLFIYLLFSDLLLIFFLGWFCVFFLLPSKSFLLVHFIFNFLIFYLCLCCFWVLFFFPSAFLFIYLLLFYLLLIFLLSFWPFFLLPLGDWSFKIVTACVYKWQFLVSSFFTPDDVLHTWHVPWHDPMV